MSTFGQWFLAQSGRGDQVGLAAKGWRDARRKPRASAPQTITNFLLADPDQVPELGKDEIEAAMAAAVGQYHEGSYHAGPAVPAPRLDLPQPPPSPPAIALASVPDSPVSAVQEPAEGSEDWQMIRWMARQMAGLDERLAGLQELITDSHDHLREAVERTEKRVAGLHELYVAFLQACEPLMQLAADLKVSDEKIGAMQADVVDGDAPQSLSDQLGYAGGGSPSQQAAWDIAQGNGWLPGPVFEAPGDEVLDWAGGLCEAHCRADRCAYGCDCPGHRPDGVHIIQTRAGSIPPGNPYPETGLYGVHIVPEPTQAQWRAWHEAGQ